MIAAPALPPAPLAIVQGCETDVICPVVLETARTGWPHLATEPERHAIAQLVMAKYLRTTGELNCRWPTGTVGHSTCRIIARVNGRVRARFTVTVKVWEDGSYRLTRVRKGGK